MRLSNLFTSVLNIWNMVDIDISNELYELRGVFPDLSRSDFYHMANGNIGVKVTYETEDFFTDDFDVLIEYHDGYPDSEPNAWVQDPKIDDSNPHHYGFDEYGDCHICYVGSQNWSFTYTGFDAAMMIKTWIFSYCHWQDTGEWHRKFDH